MRMLVLSALLGAALAAGCEAQSQSAGGPQGWRAGPYYGPMMGYGYCPGGASDQAGAQQGWYGSGMMGGRGMMGGGHMMGSGQGMMGAGPMMGAAGAFDPEQAHGWLESAKSQIGITAAQEQSWQAYADAVEADRASMRAMHQQMPAMMSQSGGDAPDRLQAHLGFMQARLASLQQVQQTSQALFQALTPEQRERADQVLWSGCWR
jgi:LTXXQ motif family protein